MKKGKKEVDRKEKAGTAWSHSYLNQKPWHPLSYPNQRRKWIAEQTHAQKEDRRAEVAREFAQEQEFFRQTAQMSKKEKEKMENLQAVSFLYMRPPGYNAEAARAAELADERKRLGLTNVGNPDATATDDPVTNTGRGEGSKKEIAKDVFGRALPSEQDFPVLKNAPRHDTGVATRVKPFAVEIRNVKCARCGASGHQSGDRECPMKDVTMPNEEARLRREDPLNTIMAHTAMDEEPLTWELKQKPGGLSPARGGFRPDDPNQQIIPDEDIYDEYGGFFSGGGEEGTLNISNLLSSITNKQRRELTDVNGEKTSKHKKRKKEKSKSRHSRRRKYDSNDSDRKLRTRPKDRKEVDSSYDELREQRSRSRKKLSNSDDSSDGERRERRSRSRSRKKLANSDDRRERRSLENTKHGNSDVRRNRRSIVSNEIYNWEGDQDSAEAAGGYVPKSRRKHITRSRSSGSSGESDHRRFRREDQRRSKDKNGGSHGGDDADRTLRYHDIGDKDKYDREIAKSRWRYDGKRSDIYDRTLRRSGHENRGGDDDDEQGRRCPAGGPDENDQGRFKKQQGRLKSRDTRSDTDDSLQTARSKRSDDTDRERRKLKGHDRRDTERRRALPVAGDYEQRRPKHHDEKANKRDERPTSSTGGMRHKTHSDSGNSRGTETSQTHSHNSDELTSD